MAVVHLHLLCEVSGFFRELAGPSPGEMPFSFSMQTYSPDMSWDTLQTFVHWIYFNKFFDGDKDQYITHELQWHGLLDLYILADAWDIMVPKNVVVDELISALAEAVPDQGFPCYYSKKIYKYTKPGEPLRFLWVDFYKGAVSEAEFEEEMQSDALDPEFVKELSLSFIRSDELFDKCNPPYFSNASAYHLANPETGECYCRVRFEGGEYEHKSEYDDAQKRAIGRLATAQRQARELTSQLTASDAAARALRLELAEKTSALLRKEEDNRLEKSKADNQLLRLENTNLKSEQDKDKKIKQLENTVQNMQNSVKLLQSSKDRDANTARNQTRTLEEQLQARTKEVENLRRESEDVKRRKLDSDWRPGR